MTPGTASAATYPDNVAQPVNFGDAGNFGPAGGLTLNAPPVGMAPTHDGQGYWIVASDGGIFNYGDAAFFGSAGGITLNKPIVGMAATPDGGGYWLVASDGGIFSYGDAQFYGSTGIDPPQPAHRRHGRHPRRRRLLARGLRRRHLRLRRRPVLRLHGVHPPQPARRRHGGGPGGSGYWLVASDGGIFNYGTAPFLGSMGGTPLNAPIVGMAATASGYWMAAKDGGVFNYGSPVPRLHGRPGQPQPDPGHCGHAVGPGLLAPADVSPPPVPPTVQLGSTGAAVASLQTQLYALGYWVDTTNGSFDDSTQQAVWALQKAANLPRDGVVGPATWAALAGRGRPPAATRVGLRDPDQPGERPDHGRQQQPPPLDAQHVDRRRLHLHAGRLHRRGHHAHRGVQHLPGGRRDGDRLARHAVPAAVLLPGLRHPRRLGRPARPVSHGCARISNEAINWIWAANIDPIGTTVWVY